MSGKTTLLIIIICGLTASRSPGADGPASFSREDVQKYAPALTVQLRSANPANRKKAIDVLHQIAAQSPRGLSDNLTQWVDPLIETEQYEDVLTLCAAAINDRAFEISTVEKLEDARVRALMGQEKLDQALSEAKSFYNICLLASTDYAIDLLTNILERQSKAAVASRMRVELTSAPLTPPNQPVADAAQGAAGFENGLPSLTVLGSIKVDASDYQETLDRLVNGHTFNNFIARGNLLLLADHPADARKSFEAALAVADSSSSKNMREAIEGIARSIRDEKGSAEAANVFVLNVRQNPSKALSSSTDAEKLREVARQVNLAPVRSMAAPALEEDRAKHEAGTGQSKPDINIDASFDAASPLHWQNVTATHLKITLAPQISSFCDWFFFRVDGASGQTIRIDLASPLAPLDRWWTVNPVYCDAADYDHPDMPAKNRRPSSTVVPSDSSEAAILPDTQSQSWSYIPNAWRSDGRTFSFVQHFESDHVYVAMRVPYTASLNERFFHDVVSPSKLANVIQVGRSSMNRPLLMAEIGGGDKNKPCILLYGGEHADEVDGMWAARGAIEFLIGDSARAEALRSQATFLIIPQIDPDGTDRAIHEGINTTFLTKVKSPESVQYSNWFQNWVNQNNRLDLVFDLHNMQSSEMGHLQCWLMEGVGERGQLSSLVHQSVFKAIQSTGFEMTATPVQRGWSPDRLGGWLSRRYGPLTFLYELNSQAPQRHQTLQELKQTGVAIITAASDFMIVPEGAKLTANVDARRQERLARWSAHPEVSRGTNAIDAESIVSKDVGVAADGKASNNPVEKWVP